MYLKFSHIQASVRFRFRKFPEFLENKWNVEYGMGLGGGGGGCCENKNIITIHFIIHRILPPSSEVYGQRNTLEIVC